jgi:rubrerythrin
LIQVTLYFHERGSLDRLFYSYIALLEHETSLAYELLVEKCNDLGAKLLLVSVLEDTKKHANIMKSVCQSLGQPYPPPIARSQAEMGQVYVDSLSHVRSIKLGLQVGMSLFEALKIILEDEKTISEEYVSLLHSKLTLVEEDNMALERIVRDIAADEYKHQDLLKLVLDSVS